MGQSSWLKTIIHNEEEWCMDIIPGGVFAEGGTAGKRNRRLSTNIIQESHRERT